ncbi:MAG: DUF4386 domain-containing protein [Thermoanaerobaculia bacterium]
MTAANIAAHESLYRAGLVADLIMLASYVVVTLILFDLLRLVNRRLSLLAAFFRLVGIAVLAANSLNQLAPLTFLQNAAPLGAFETAELQALARSLPSRCIRGATASPVSFSGFTAS